MKTPKININSGTVLKGISIGLAGIAFVVSNLLDAHNQKQLKDDVVKEVLKEVSNQKN